jgi:hypothetical protein
MNKKTLIIVALALLVATPVAAQQVKVKHNRTPLRTEARASSVAVVYLDAGSVLDLTGTSNDWYKVRDPKTKVEGYVKATLVEMLPGGAAPRPSQPPSGLSRPPAAGPVTKANRWTDRALIGMGAVYQSGTPQFSEEYSVTEYLEPARTTTDYPAAKGPGFDVGAAVRVWRNLAIGVSVTGATRSGDASIRSSIPHPFYFNSGRPVEGTASVDRSEYAGHIHALWVIPAGRRLMVAIGGGPTVFSVKQSLVERFTYAESYPYDTATFASASVNSASATAVGAGVTLDVEYYLTRTIGIGGVARFAKASVSLPSHGSTIKVDAGGFEGGIGLRIRIPRGKPKAKPPAQPVLPKLPVRK